MIASDALKRTLLVATLLCGLAQAADFDGRPVSAVLDELKSQGLTLIYSSELVPAGLRVVAEPQARTGIDLAREILAQHSLALSQIAPNVFAVVKGAAPQPAAPASTDESILSQVVVSTSRYSLTADAAAAHTFLTQEQMHSMPRLADETLRAVQRLPGVASNGFSSVGSIRGGEPNEQAIVLDGLRLYEPFHLKDFLSPISLLDSRVIDGVDVYAGGYPATFGNRMSAIIDTTTVHPVAWKEGDNNKPRYFEAGLSVFHLSGLAASQFAGGRGEALLSARHSNLAELAQFSEHDFGEPDYSDGFARVDYRFGDATRASLNFLVSRDRIEAQRGDGEQRARAEYRGNYTWAAVTHDWSNDDHSRVIASFTDVSNEREGWLDVPGQRTGTVKDLRGFHIAGLQLDNTFVSRDLEQRMGGEVRWLQAQYDYANQVRYEAGYPFPYSPVYQSQFETAPQPKGYEAGLFYDARVRLAHRWVVQAGIRFDQQTYDSSGDAAQWSPRLGLLYEFGPDTTMRASWGHFFQPHAINELQVEDKRDTFNPVQESEHWIVSFEHAFADVVDLRVEAYRKDYRRVSPRYENMFDPLALMPELEYDRVEIIPYRARAEGAELLVRVRPVASFSGWFGYTWSRAEDKVNGAIVPRSWDQRHAITFGVVWSHGPWTATVTDSYHSGWPTTALQIDGTPPTQTADIQPRNSSRLGDYNSVDVRATRTFELKYGVLEAYVEVSNLFSRSNPCCTQYDVSQDPSGALIADSDTQDWLPIVPSVGLLWRY